MPFQLSPGVNVTEIDLTTVVPAVASSDGAIAGIFNWGPVGERILIDTEDKLKTVFGKPTTDNAETWFTAANFLSYSNRLYVVRAADTTANTGNSAWNAVANTNAITGGYGACVVKNKTHFETKSFDADVNFVARYPGAIGNSLKVSLCDSVNAFSSPVYTNASDYSNAAYYVDVTSSFTLDIGNTQTIITTVSGSANAAAAQQYAQHLVGQFTVGDYFVVGNSSIGQQYMQVASVNNATSGVFTLRFTDAYNLHTSYQANSSVNTETNRTWEYFNVVDTAPTTTDYVAQFGNTAAIDGVHVVVVDEDGKFTGTPGTILETYANLSRATDAKTVGGADNYYKTVINQASQYIWSISELSLLGLGYTRSALDVYDSNSKVPATISLAGGQNGYTESSTNLATIASGYDLFASAEDVDISLILQGKPVGGTSTSGGMTVQNFQLANYLIDNIAETRKDCVVFISPDDSIVSGHINNEATALVNWRNVIHDSSYAVLDSGYKYQYDKYNDVYRYLPINGDIAGLCARTDNQKDPWWSPAGFNRGQIKNLVKLRFNPRKADRDIIYKNGINPVASFPGQGTVLFGDKTLQSKPSAFDRINVRRLFIVLEKAIATASKFTLFEFNDEFTRAQFKNLVTPYLRDVQGRRGITDFLVVCDGTNNTPERIDRNEFWGDIYIKPARSINFIQLNFVAVRTGVQFSEIVGQF
jgi:Phage tail sheath protein subtilisin-like domain/Phage tail sheath C-terminal domain